MQTTTLRMPGEEKKVIRHAISLDKRESMLVTGVKDVISFDEVSVIAETEMGIIVVRGINLHVKRINLEAGELSVTGEIDSFSYESPGGTRKGKSLVGRLFK